METVLRYAELYQTEIAIIGAASDPATRDLLRAVHRGYTPNKVVARLDPADNETPKRVPLLADRPQLDGKPTAYVCRGYACDEPTTEPRRAAEQVAGLSRAGS